MDTQDTLQNIKRMKQQYSELIEYRMQELELPEEEKNMKTDEFERAERYLCDKISDEKLRLGINDKAGEGVLCCECLNIFVTPKQRKSYRKRSGNVYHSFYGWCKDHKGIEPVIYDEISH